VIKNKWARGIVPRYFHWVIDQKLAVSERPGGYSRNHRPVRRQEEIIWLREEGFTRVVSLLSSPHNLHAYEQLGLIASHIPYPPADSQEVLPDLFASLDGWIAAGEKVLVHMEELSDQVMGIMAAYLLHAGFPGSHAQVIGFVERVVGRPMGNAGRLVVQAVSDAHKP
jgi:hypothetical protein